jgi:hypothetical protein
MSLLPSIVRNPDPRTGKLAGTAVQGLGLVVPSYRDDRVVIVPGSRCGIQGGLRDGLGLGYPRQLTRISRSRLVVLPS